MKKNTNTGRAGGEGIVEEVGVAERGRGGEGGGGVGVNEGKEQKVILTPLVQGRAVRMFPQVPNQMMCIMRAMFVGCVGAVIGLLVTHRIFVPSGVH